MAENSPRPAQQNSGNILIYILGAIFLMGLLIVVLKGNTQEGIGIDSEKSILRVGEVQRYGAELERAVNYILKDGYSETELRFAHPTGDSAYSDYGAISSVPARQVFSPQGGGAEWMDIPAGIQTIAAPWAFSGVTGAEGIGTTCTTAQCVDLIAFLPYVTKEFCLAVNNANGITNPSGDAPADPDSFSWNIPFVGTYTYSFNLETTGSYTASKMEGCVKSGTLYWYYRVLLAR